MKLTWKKVLGFIVILFILIQFYPVKRTNPPVTSEFDGPLAVKKVLEVSCNACHSNKTKWPWYSYVAPVSWMVAHDVTEGRKEFNLSEWGDMTPKKRAKRRKQMWDEVKEGEMPGTMFELMHPEARLTEEQKKVLKEWSAGASVSSENAETAK